MPSSSTAVRAPRDPFMVISEEKKTSAVFSTSWATCVLRASSIQTGHCRSILCVSCTRWYSRLPTPSRAPKLQRCIKSCLIDLTPVSHPAECQCRELKVRHLFLAPLLPSKRGIRWRHYGPRPLSTGSDRQFTFTQIQAASNALVNSLTTSARIVRTSLRLATPKLPLRTVVATQSPRPKLARNYAPGDSSYLPIGLVSFKRSPAATALILAAN